MLLPGHPQQHKVVVGEVQSIHASVCSHQIWGTYQEHTA